MGENEGGTVRALKGHQAEVLPLVAEFGGRIIDVAGDGILAEFHSAVAAVECALRIQSLMAQRNDGVDEARRIRFRIGINLGEVVYDETRIYGDGINVAARLENLAAPGGISVSAKVHDEVNGKLVLSFKDLGLQTLKNIAKPVQVYALMAAVGGEALPQPSVPSDAVAPRSPARRWLLVGAALVVAVAVGLAAIRMSAPSDSPAIASLAVLPFENATGDTAADYLSDGISESLINKLSGLSGLRVISRSSAFKFKAKGQALDAAEFARKLGVDAIVVGKLVLRGKELTISAEMVSLRDSAQLWGDKYSRRVDEMQQLEGEIATTIAQTLRRQLSGDERARLTRTATSDPEAHRLYLKGREFMIGNQQEMDKSVDLFQQAVVLAPDYALAHAGLANAYTTQATLRAASRAETVGKARAAAVRAIEIDPNLAEAHAALAQIRFFFDWDWSGAEAAFQRAIKLDPSSATVREDYATLLFALARPRESLAQSAEAARLDPLSVRPVHDMGVAHLVAGEREQAAARFRQGIEINPNWTWGYVKLSRTLAMLGQCTEAMVQAETAERRIAGGAEPLSRSWLGATYAQCKDTARARQKLDELQALEKRQYVDPIASAMVRASLGETELAMSGFEKALEDRSPSMVYALTELRLHPQLANTPRFNAIVQRMKFPAVGP